MNFIIEVKNLYKSFVQGGKTLHILNGVNLSVSVGEKIAIVGPSGSGKSTLFSLLAGINAPDSGDIIINGSSIIGKNESELARMRNATIGIVFQSFELVPSFTALENVMLPLNIRGENGMSSSEDILRQVNLKNRSNHFPEMLSGGEQQRVAIARALVTNPDVILADEPTGNLDVETGNKVIDIFLSEVERKNKTLILITHDMHLASKMDRIFVLTKGLLDEKHV